MTEEERGQIKTAHYGMLNDRLANMTLYSPPSTNLQGRWGDLVEPQARISTWDTGLPAPLLQFVGAKSVAIPEEIQVHSHLRKTHVQVCGLKRVTSRFLHAIHRNLYSNLESHVLECYSV